VFADKDLRVCLVDIDKEKAKTVKAGVMPFIEYGSEPLLKKTIDNGNLVVSDALSEISHAKFIIITIGTPLDQYLNPKIRAFLEFIDGLRKYVSQEQTIIIRSTIYPKTCEQSLKLFGKGDWKIAYCPERIVQGYAIKELKELPQIVSGLSESATKEAAELFELISPKVIITSVREAELIKLFSNAWRYIQFATANQFYMISNDFDVDYDKVKMSMVDGYERAVQLPGAGFAAGPCLLKDTMQLSAFDNHNFQLGYAAMCINEGLPNYIVTNLIRDQGDLDGITTVFDPIAHISSTITSPSIRLFLMSPKCSGVNATRSLVKSSLVHQILTPDDKLQKSPNTN